MPIDVELASAAENVFTQKAARIGISQRLAHDVHQVAVFAANVNVACLRTHRQAGNHHAFDHRMRIMFEDQAVFAGAGLALIAVDQHILRLVRFFGYERPLHASGEAGTAAPAQVRGFDLVDDVVRLHLERLLHGFIAVQLQITVKAGSAFTEAVRDHLDFVGM